MTLAQGMKSRGHDVVVLSTGPENGVAECMVEGIRVLRAGIKNFYWHYRSDRALAWKRAAWHLRDIYNPQMASIAGEIIRREKPDLVSCHNLVGWSAAAWGAVRRCGVPLVHVLHDPYLLCASSNMFSHGRACRAQCRRCKLFRAFHPRLSEAVDAVVGISRFILDRHAQYGYFSKAKIQIVIHNVRVMSVAGTPRPAFDGRPVRFGYIGTLAPAKGIEWLLEIFAGLTGINAELWVAGRGEENYESGLRRRFSSNRVRFLGQVAADTFYPRIDLLVVPSLWEEPLGMVVPEAFAHGVPVLGARCGGIPEMIEPGRSGLLFDADEPGSLERQLIRLAGDPDQIAAMRPGARTAAVPFLDRERWLVAYEAVYEELMSA